MSVQGGSNPPTAFLRPAAGQEPYLQVVSAPWLEAGQLSNPGDCLVLRAEKACDVVIGIRRSAPGASLDASFRMEALIVSDEAAVAEPAVRPDLALVRGEPAKPLSLLAHISMRGDVVVNENEWAGGPESPSPIEGLEARGQAGDGVALEMQVLVSSRPPRWSNWVSAGEYAGTRGRYLQLIGLRLRLTGPNASRREIAADALFLGSLVISKRGQEVEFLSKSGVDPLIGLKLAVASVELPSVGLPAFSAGRERESRVRVFRASTNA